MTDITTRPPDGQVIETTAPLLADLLAAVVQCERTVADA